MPATASVDEAEVGSERTSVRPGRLRGSRDVRRVLRDGSRRSTSRLSCHLLVDDDRAGVRLATVASRRIGNAPTRNRAKRLLREAGARVAFPPGSDVVLVARPGIGGADLWAVLDDLHHVVEARP